MGATSRQPWLERARAIAAHPRLPDAAGVALVALLGWQLAGVTWALLPAPATAAPAPASGPRAAPGETADAPAAATARLARLHLFGETRPDAGAGPAAPADASDAPETQLDLALRGVFAAGDAAGLAIVATGGGPEKVYATGDTIAGSARITGIFGDRIVLRRNGRAETLRLEQQGVAPPRGGPNNRAGNRGGDVIERARALRDRLSRNPMALARLVRFQAHREGGELVGFRIRPRTEEARLLEEIGIGPQDVVTRVNGIALDDPRRADRALRALRDAPMITVTVLRDGRSRRLSLPLGHPG